jgi:capsular polysaccharide transport system permease protein
MKPKAKRFRIKRSVSRQLGRDAETGAAKSEDAVSSSGAKAPKTVAEVSVAETIDAIRKEGLTGRQLRMARRLAQKHALAPTSDFDAVRLLRAEGIDPFQRANMLELVVADPAKKNQDNLPQTAPAAPLPSTEMADLEGAQERRAREILEIQKDIAKRRRRRVAMLFLRLALFVFLPTALAGYYYTQIATPMFATNSEFKVELADSPQAPSGGLFSGTSFANSTDSIAVQGYLNSREAMLRLDKDIGFKSHFMDPEIDPIQRLAAESSNEDAYKVYRKRVKIGYDPTEGIIKMTVVAANPETSAAYSKALIDYAEEQVDAMTQRVREDQMRGAAESFDMAEDKMEAAQMRVLELQEQLGVLDPASETSSVMAQVSNFEVQLAQKRLQLQQLLDNPRPNRARVSGVEGDISRLENLVTDLRSQLTSSSSGSGSLARVTSQLSVAQVDLQTRTMMMQESLAAMENARIEANRQIRYLTLSVTPVPPDEATYPRAFENTLVAFLIFSGIYLMLSLTASILREQVSS